jgi:hypothetical protein
MSVERARSSGAISRMRRSRGVSGRGLAPVSLTISSIVSSRFGGKKSGIALAPAQIARRDQNRVPPPNWNH